jgi:hypothetical protein
VPHSVQSNRKLARTTFFRMLLVYVVWTKGFRVFSEQRRLHK